MGNNGENSSEGQMTFFEHLDALRPHLLRSVVAILIIMIAAFFSKDFIIDKVLMGPQSPNFPLNRLFEYLSEKWGIAGLKLNNYSLNMINTNLYGQFNLHMKISIMTGVALAVPYTTWELWRFVKPALTPKELKSSRMFVGYVSLCFFSGLFFGYFVITPLTINFFAGYTVSGDITNMIDIKSYLSTVINTGFACGILFQLPIFIYFLSKMGLITAAFMRKYRRHAVVLLLVFSAIITPPDAVSLIMVVLPLYGLYELGIVIAGRIEKKRALEEAEYYGEEEHDEEYDEDEEEEGGE